MVWRRVRPDQCWAVQCCQQAKANQVAFPRASSHGVAGRRAGEQAAARLFGRKDIQGGGEGYKRSEVKCTGCWRKDRMESGLQCFCCVLSGRERPRQCGMECWLAGYDFLWGSVEGLERA